MTQLKYASRRVKKDLVSLNPFNTPFTGNKKGNKKANALVQNETTKTQQSSSFIIPYERHIIKTLVLERSERTEDLFLQSKKRKRRFSNKVIEKLSKPLVWFLKSTGTYHTIPANSCNLFIDVKNWLVQNLPECQEKIKMESASIKQFNSNLTNVLKNEKRNSMYGIYLISPEKKELKNKENSYKKRQSTRVNKILSQDIIWRINSTGTIFTIPAGSCQLICQLHDFFLKNLPECQEKANIANISRYRFSSTIGNVLRGKSINIKNPMLYGLSLLTLFADSRKKQVFLNKAAAQQRENLEIPENYKKLLYFINWKSHKLIAIPNPKTYMEEKLQLCCQKGHIFEINVKDYMTNGTCLKCQILNSDFYKKSLCGANSQYIGKSAGLRRCKKNYKIYHRGPFLIIKCPLKPMFEGICSKDSLISFLKKNKNIYNQFLLESFYLIYQINLIKELMNLHLF